MQEPTRPVSGKAEVDGMYERTNFHLTCRGVGDGMVCPKKS